MNRKDHLYLWLTGIFVAALVVSDLIGAKVFRVAGHDLSVGMIPFPLTFVLTDVINEFYGPGGARRTTFVGLAAAVFTFIVINIAMALPTSPESPLSAQSFRSTFGWSTRLYIGSILAYVIAQMLDIATFGALRGVTKHRLLWLRATGSTVVSQVVDTFVVTFVLFTGSKSMDFILRVVRDSYLVKLLIAIAMTPIIYLLHGFLDRVLHVPEGAAPGDESLT